MADMFSLADLIPPNLSAYSSLYDGLDLGQANWQAPTDSFDNVSGSSGEWGWTPEALERTKDMQFSQRVSPNMNIWTDVYKGGKKTNSFQTGEYDTSFDQLQGLVGAIMAGAALGPVAKAFGGGLLGNVGAGSLLGGATAFGTGQDVGKGMLGGAVTGSLAGFSPTQMAGLDQNWLTKSLDAGARGTLGGMFKGQSFSDSLKGGLGSAVGSGINSLGQNLFSSSPEVDFNDLPGSMGDVGDGSEQQYTTPNEFGDFRSYVNPSDVGGFLPTDGQTGQTDTREQPQSTSGLGGLFSSFQQNFPDVTGYIGNNLGDIAGALYGMYNNRKNMKGLKSQMGALSGLSDPNGAYAKQLRRSLERKDAQMGRRSDYAGRETQLMAELAKMGAQTAPAMYQMQGALNTNRNNNMVGLLKMGQQSGLFSGLANMFMPQQATPNFMTGGGIGNIPTQSFKMPDWMNLSLGGSGG